MSGPPVKSTSFVFAYLSSGMGCTNTLPFHRKEIILISKTQETFASIHKICAITGISSLRTPGVPRKLDIHITKLWDKCKGAKTSGERCKGATQLHGEME